MAKSIPQMTPQERVQYHEKNVAASLTKYQLRQHLTVRFNNHTKVPLLGKLGVWLVNKTGGTIATIYGLDSGTINSNSRRQK